MSNFNADDARKATRNPTEVRAEAKVEAERKKQQRLSELPSILNDMFERHWVSSIEAAASRGKRSVSLSTKELPYELTHHGEREEVKILLDFLKSKGFRPRFTPDMSRGGYYDGEIIPPNLTISW